MRHFQAHTIRPDKKESRRTLRQNATTAEEILWRFLRNNQLGYKFRRQFDIQSFVVDFYCHSLKIVVELDGWTHDSEKTKKRDVIKQQVLEKAGYKVFRLKNGEVYGDIEKVLNKIVVACKIRTQELAAVT